MRALQSPATQGWVAAPPRPSPCPIKPRWTPSASSGSGGGAWGERSAVSCAADRSDESSTSAPDPPPQTLSRRAVGAALSASAAAGLAPPLGAEAGAAIPQGSPTPPPGRLRENKFVMRVSALRGSVPQQWGADLAAALEGYGLVALTQRAQLADIYAELRGTGKGGKAGAPTTVDAVTLGDAWLERAIAEGLIQPIPDAADSRWWGRLSPRWRQLVRRDASGRPDAGGQVWGAPYRWGATLVAYQRERLLRRGGAPIRDWGDLLQPALEGRVGFVDSPREVVAIALKSLGLPLNASAADLRACGVSEGSARARVRALVRQARVFSGSEHVRALEAGDVMAVVGWSDDLVPLAARSGGLALVAPLSGTALWADLFCVPTHAAGGATDGEPSPLLPAWLELPLQPVRAQRSRGLRGGASPLLLPGGPQRGGGGACSPLPEPMGSGSGELAEGALPGDDVLLRSEFLLPLGPETQALYRRLLQPDG